MLQEKKNILLAVDGSPHSFNAVRYVAQTCPPTDLKVTLMLVMSTSPETIWDLEQDAFFKEKLLAENAQWQRNVGTIAQRVLCNAKNTLVKAGVAEEDVGLILKEREAGIARDIIEESERGYDAVAVGKRGLSKLEDLFLGSVSNKIVEGIKDIPVWVVGRDILSNKMLIAVDASENSRKAVDYAGSFAAGTEAELTLYHVVRGFEVGFMNDLTVREEITAEFIDQVGIDVQHMLKSYRERLEKAGVAATRISIKYTLSSTSRSGDIIEEAKEGNYGTIVIGRKGLSKVHEFLLGRVTNKVLIRADKQAVWIVP